MSRNHASVNRKARWVLLLAALLTLVMAVSAQSATVRLNKRRIILVKGKTYQLKLLNNTKKVKWKSNNRSIVTARYGKLVAKASGRTTVTATVGKKVYTCRVLVRDAKIVCNAKTLAVGKKTTLSITEGKAKAWGSTNKSVLTVNSNGRVTAKKAGTARVWAQVGVHKIYTKITVVEKKDVKIGTSAWASILSDSMSSIPSGTGVTSFGGYQMSSSVKNALASAIGSARSSGNAGFVMIDLTTGMGVASGAYSVVYAASTMKGPYVASLCAANSGAFYSYRGTICNILQWSSNDDYKRLYNTFGSSCLRSFANKCGASSRVTSAKYPWIYPADLAKLWVQCFKFFRGSSFGNTVGTYYQAPNVSALYQVFKGKYTTRSKAGWIAESAYHACNCAGIVYAGDHPYVVSIMTSIWGTYSNQSRLYTLVRQLEAAHNEMVAQM